jgi:hypothetical protein
MIKLKQAECGHWVKRDAPANAIVMKRTKVWDLGFWAQEDLDTPVVFCKKCIERITSET